MRFSRFNMGLESVTDLHSIFGLNNLPDKSMIVQYNICKLN